MGRGVAIKHSCPGARERDRLIVLANGYRFP